MALAIRRAHLFHNCCSASVCTRSLPPLTKGDRTAQSAIRFAPVERLLYRLAQADIVDELQDVACTAEVVELPKRLFRLVLAFVAGELAHDGGLRDLLLPERGH
jgi:hypothetical protein